MRYTVKFDLELKKNIYGGLYIALEGIDGSGKTTQVKELEKYFKSQGKEVVVSCEPTREGEVGELIHKILRGEIKIPRIFNQYLFSVDRGLNQQNFIIPALREGKVVLSDRSFWSSLAYGILDKETDESDVQKRDQLLVSLSILSMYHQFIVPDATVYLDVSAKTAMGRLDVLNKETEIYEKIDLLKRLEQTYNMIANEFSEVFLTVNGSMDKEKVTGEILQKLPSK